MQLICFNAASKRRAEHDRSVIASARTVAHARRLHANLVEGFINKADELNFRHRAEPLNAKSDCKSADRGFGERRIEYAVFSEFPLQAFSRTEHAANVAHVF